jgi:hypothetical protein
MERVLADVDADDGDLIGGRVGHGRAPSKAAPIQLCSPVGREHGRTIPLADFCHPKIAQLVVDRREGLQSPKFICKVMKRCMKFAREAS